MNKLVLSRPAWNDGPQELNIQEAFESIYKILIDEQITDKKDAYKKTNIYIMMNEISKYASSTLLGQFDYINASETAEKLNYIPKDAPNHDRNEWKTIECETLILVSKNDPIHPYKYGYLLNEYIPNSKLVEITSKDVSSVQHNIDSNITIKEFLE
ncbi:hypothetical protein G7059_09975 [Erysipelothrix sp. HDW6A]|nr:hypothetical protein G7059_09975 [Erysipelothrix sp. HDW6A]